MEVRWKDEHGVVHIRSEHVVKDGPERSRFSVCGESEMPRGAWVPAEQPTTCLVCLERLKEDQQGAAFRRVLLVYRQAR